jgi:GNAT superfamily N-acetyltransferase
VASPAFTIRAAGSFDVHEMARLFGQLGYEISVDVLTRRMQAFEQAGEIALVAEDDVTPGRLLAVATLHATPVLHRAGPVGRVSALVVDAEVRGRGVGGAMMAAAEQWAAERGCILMEVTSNQRRVDAHRFYEGLGYEHTSFRFARVPRRAAEPPDGTDVHTTRET